VGPRNWSSTRAAAFPAQLAVSVEFEVSLTRSSYHWHPFFPDRFWKFQGKARLVNFATVLANQISPQTFNKLQK
jgi:hypothetical protein